MNAENTEKLSISLESGKKLNYRLIRKRSNRHCYMYIKNGSLEIRSPAKMGIADIERFIRHKERWISRHIEKSKKRQIDPKEHFLYIGVKYPVSIVAQRDASVREMEFDGKTAIFRLSVTQEADIRKEIENLTESYYKTNAPNVILPRVRYWSEKMGLTPSKVSFRKARSRWGSCSTKNTISLNTRLLCLPQHLSDYIIVHELAHIIHKNHSREFWRCVERYIPDTKAYRLELREYTLQTSPSSE